MDAKVAAILAALAPAVEKAVAAAVTVAAGPAAGAAVEVVEGIANAYLPKPTEQVVINTPITPNLATPVGASVVQPTNDQYSQLAAQVAALTAALSKQQQSLTAASVVQGQGVHVDPVPGAGVQPFVQDPTAHPILVAMGKAPMVPPPVTDTDQALDPATSTLGDIIAAVNALQSKVAALVEATGMGGSAAMAAHA